jgi:hypothetical protein
MCHFQGTANSLTGQEDIMSVKGTAGVEIGGKEGGVGGRETIYDHENQE